MQLKNLRQLYLNVSVNKITDNAFNKLETHFIDGKQQINVDKLELLVLDMSLNSLTSHEKSNSIRILANLLSQMKNLYKLQLNLEDNCIKMFGSKYLMDTITQLSKINDLELNLSQNEVTDNGVYSICDYLQNIGDQQLQKFKLFVANNQLSDKFVKQLSMGLSNTIYLEQLTLWFNNNQSGNKHMEMLAQCFDKMELLSYLNINMSYQQISDLSIKHLSLAILKINTLQTFKLYLDRIAITDKGCKYISKAISMQSNLQELVLSLNSIKTISTPSLVYIGLSFQKLRLLKTFSLSMQGVPLQQNEGFRSISQSFQNLKQLVSFSLQFTQCQIDGPTAQILVYQLKVLKKLQNFYICLNDNNISERDQDIIRQQLKSHYKQNEYILRL